MEITLLMKIAGIGILVSVGYLVLSKVGREEMAMLISVAGIVIILLMIVGRLSELIETVESVFGL